MRPAEVVLGILLCVAVVQMFNLSARLDELERAKAAPVTACLPPARPIATAGLIPGTRTRAPGYCWETRETAPGEIDSPEDVWEKVGP